APERAPRLRLEGHDLLDRLHDPVERQLERPRDLLIPSSAQVLEVLLDDLDRDGIGVGVAAELEEQALLGGAGGCPRRVEQPDQPEPALHAGPGPAPALAAPGQLAPE